MNFFGLKKKNRNLTKSLQKLGKEIHGEKVMTTEETWQYFMKCGFDYKGQVQSFYNSKGNSMTGTLKIDLVALGFACAGIPAPNYTPLKAEVGGGLTVSRASHTILILHMGPAMHNNCPICLSALNGWFIDTEITLEAEIGVQTPKLDFLPKSSGDQAEVASFTLGAEATVGGSASLGGRHLYAEDPSPSWYNRDQSDQLRTKFIEVLSSGSSKGAVKKAALSVFDLNRKIKNLKPKRGLRVITGGNIPTTKIIECLGKARSVQGISPQLVGKIDQNIGYLRPWLTKASLNGYCFISLWGGHGKGDIGVQAKAEAKISAGIGGVINGEIGAEAKIQGPKLDVETKRTLFRYQTCSKPKIDNNTDIRVIENIKKIKRQGAIPLVGLAREISSTPNTLVQTQDTSITYGQINFTALKLSGEVGANINQDIVNLGDGEKIEFKDSDLEEVSYGSDLSLEKEINNDWTGKHGFKGTNRARAGVGIKGFGAEAESRFEGKLGLRGGGKSEVSLGLGGVGAKLSGDVGLEYELLNFMQYKSATAYWEIPSELNAKYVKTCSGTGYAFGQSVVVENLFKYGKEAIARKNIRGSKKMAFLQRLGASLRVSYETLLSFIENNWWLIEALPTDPNFKPGAVLLESTFKIGTPKQIRVRYKRKNEKFTLGPGRGSSLRKIIIPKQISHHKRNIESIRLRYRIADTNDDDKSLFSLGFKYIVGVGINLKSVNRAGSEGVVDLATWWCGRMNTKSGTQAYEEGVPPVALLHQ